MLKEALKKILTTKEKSVYIESARFGMWNYIHYKASVSYLNLIGHPVAESLYEQLPQLPADQKEISTKELKKMIIKIIKQSTPQQKLNIILNLPNHLRSIIREFSGITITDRINDSFENHKYSYQLTAEIFAIACLGLWELEDDKNESKATVYPRPYFLGDGEE